MVYEVKREEETQAQWDEMKKITQTNVCAQCGGELTIHTVPEKGALAVGCLNKEHHGYVERASYTALMRRGEAILHPGIQGAIERKMMPKEDLGRAMNLLALRYPRTIENPESAALFIMDCMRLNLDPLIQPAEAVPIPFKSKKGKEEKTTVAMVVTEDGWLSMCARGCQAEWNGPPRTMRLEEYLTTLPENKKLSREGIAKLAADIKDSACKDQKAWYYVAIGRSKTMTEDAVIPGWFTERDMKKAEAGNLPAFYEPGNQARVRAIKKWVRHVYPECRQKMIELTREWYQRSEGVKAAQQFIDAEYSVLVAPEGDEKTGATEKESRVGEAKVGEAVFSSPKGEAETSAVAAEETIEGEGFHIDLNFLKEAQKALKWTDDTCKTFLVSKYKVSPQGTLTDVISRLNRQQAEEFVRELSERLAQKPRMI